MENKLDREIEKKRLKKCNIRKKNEKKNTQPTNNNSKNVKGNIPLWKKKEWWNEKIVEIKQTVERN